MPERINVRGSSGAGKSTFSQELARRLGLTWIELDALSHGPNWSAPTVDVFREQVRAAMDAAPAGWVIDGDYDGKLGNTVLGVADTIVWLDLPLWVSYPRMVRRTIHRLRHDVELWNGNRETWRDQFASRESIFYWTLRLNIRQRRTWPERFGNDPRLVRLRTDAEVRRWLDSLAQDTR
jgi:adenylate kinase family enzyme